MKKTQLTEADYARAAADLQVPVNIVKAVTRIEAPRGFFNDDGSPVILFERHHFHRHTGGQYDQAYPSISSPSPGGYGKYSQQHAKLGLAAQLDREAALKACSWGGFQILGSNFKQAGYPTLQAFINGMYSGADEQLDAFVRFVKADPVMHRALKRRDWTGFANRYNGPGQARPPGVTQDYDYRLRKAFEALEAGK